MTSMVTTEFASVDEICAGLSRGTTFFTPDRVTAGLRLRIGLNVPPPRLTQADLARMKRLNHCLIWQPAETLDGQAVTMKLLHDTCSNVCHQGGKFLYNVDWYPAEDFYCKHTPRGGWREVSLAPISKSYGKTFCQQLRVLVDYLKAEVWPDGLPEEVLAAIAEFEAQEQALLELEQKDWKAAAKQEASLQICDYLTTPVEQSVLMLVHQQTNGERFLGNVWSRTGILSSGGRLVHSGDFGSGGAGVGGWRPGDVSGDMGVCFSAEVKK